jgi:FAD/FMN-containing dehydrogenase
METCVRAGGSITGEHGVGLDKSGYLPLIFSDDDMDAMLRVRAAFDPSGLCNPGKIIPQPRGCGEARAVATQTLSEPRAVATGSIASEVLTDHPTKPSIRPTNVRLAERINEVRVTNEIKGIVGAVNIEKLCDRPAFAKSEFAAGSDRALVVSPLTADDVQKVLDLAKRERLSVVPAGNLSRVDTGNTLAPIDLIVSTRRMKKLVHHEPADLVATAEAGITLNEFQKQLSERGQWLPVDPTDDGSATLGGVVAVGLSGPQTAGYGALRSFVIGLRAMLADGRAIKAGGQVVKNVAGYDLCKLFTGSFGTLGLITEITFKLRPLPPESRTIIAGGPRDSLVEIGRHLADQFFPVALEILSPRLAEKLLPVAKRGDYGLLIRIAGPARAVITHTAQALKVFRDQNLVCETEADEALLWQKLSSAGCQPLHDLTWRATVRPSELTAFANEVAELESDEASQVELQWHAGLVDGRLRAAARAPVYHQESVRVLERLRQRAENLGGNLIIEKAPIEIKNEIDCWGSFGSATALMQRVKRQLDPENSLSPGRLFG